MYKANIYIFRGDFSNVYKILKEKMKIVLFDMDGTLTKPRKKIDRETAMALYSLSQHADIGIVTGSGLDYVLEQCSILWDKPEFFIGDKITLLPCNGTMAYVWRDN